MCLSMFPCIATIIVLPVFHASIKMPATDTLSGFGSEIGVLATLDEVMKLMFGYTPIAQLGDDFRPEPFRSYFDLRHRITKLRRKLAYRSFQLPSSDFQIKVREEMARSVSERDGTLLLVWSQVVDELRQASYDSRDDEILRRLVVNRFSSSSFLRLSYRSNPAHLGHHALHYSFTPYSAVSSGFVALQGHLCNPRSATCSPCCFPPFLLSCSPSAGASVSAVQAVQNNAPPRKTWQQRKRKISRRKPLRQGLIPNHLPRS